MKRTSEEDFEWAIKLEQRKQEAERKMRKADNMNGFFTIEYLKGAARQWACDEHTAEQRLLRGELPEDGQ